MEQVVFKNPESLFLAHHIPILLNRFSLFYKKDATCIEYTLYKQSSNRQISKSLIVSHEIFPNSIYVSKFYPEIYKQLNCRYLSAACFYMLVHHAASTFLLPDHCNVNLETDQEVYKDFYARLNDFDFKIFHSRPAQRCYVRGQYHQMPFFTDMIIENS